FHIDWLKHCISTANQGYNRSGTNKIGQSFDERGIHAKEHRWLDDRPIQATLLQHLFCQVSPLHVAARPIRPCTKATHFNHTFDASLFGYPDQVCGTLHVGDAIILACRLLTISGHKSSMYDSIDSVHCRL